MGQRSPRRLTDVSVDPTAIVDARSKIGIGSQVWAYAQIRENVSIGKQCMIGNGAYIDSSVKIGDRCNIHNKALLYRNLKVESDVFIGPGVCFINDPKPRANRIRSLKGKSWRVKNGASIGANASIMSDITIGKYAVVGAGAVVTKNVPDHVMVYGNPARFVDFVDESGDRVTNIAFKGQQAILKSEDKKFKYILSRKVYDKIKST
jgi:UDP-2-acetamido-3-amino-2,3-dideoxy-glucuronate N-acetyltransferase